MVPISPSVWLPPQRVWGDNDQFEPEMVSRCGLRWYKNRVIVNYDLDAKDPFKAKPATNNEGLKTLMTMCYVVSARFLMARGFYQLSAEQLYIMSRTFPYHALPKSSRPVDAFTNGFKVPRVFDYEVNPQWHQLTLYNSNKDSLKEVLNTFGVNLGTSLNEGGLGLRVDKSYYLYDFWNDHLVGKFNGNDILKQQLRSGETRMISIHEAEENPQFISTNRHIMQGLVDMTGLPQWNSHTGILTGKSKVVGGETYKVTIALNGYRPLSAKAKNARVEILATDKRSGLAVMSVNADTNCEVEWSVTFKK